MDRRRVRAIAPVARIATIATLAGASLVAAAGSVAACTGPLTSFRAALPTAERVVIGDVVRVDPGGAVPGASDGRSSWFTLRVLHAPRGEITSVIDVRELQSWECGPLLAARAGDRIALALGATDLDPPVLVNTMAWVKGLPPAGMGAETITVAEVLALLGPGAPSTATLPDVDGAPAGEALTRGVVLLMIGLVAVSVGWRRYDPSRHLAIKAGRRRRG